MLKKVIADFDIYYVIIHLFRGHNKRPIVPCYITARNSLRLLVLYSKTSSSKYLFAGKRYIHRYKVHDLVPFTGIAKMRI